MRRAVIVPLVALGLCASACARSGAAPVEPSTQVAATQLAPAGAAAADPVFSVPIDGLPILGEPNALVTIVEFTDYECDYCRQAEATITQLRSDYGADLRVVVAEHPMPVHTKARPAALAALAAAAQGHLEGMHDRLFAGQLDEASIQQAAKAEGLTLARFDETGTVKPWPRSTRPSRSPRRSACPVRRPSSSTDESSSARCPSRISSR